MLFYSGSIMFLLTTFLMEGPPPKEPPTVKHLAGHDNVVFSGDEATLPTITALVRNTKRVDDNSCRL